LAAFTAETGQKHLGYCAAIPEIQWRMAEDCRTRVREYQSVGSVNIAA